MQTQKLLILYSADSRLTSPTPNVPAGATITFHLWIPTGSTLTAIQRYAMQGAAGGWAWSGSWRSVSTLRAGNWNTLTVNVPVSAAPLAELGVVFTLSGPANGASAFIDSISY